MGWLEEDEGEFTLVYKRKLTSPIPPFAQVQVGGTIPLGGEGMFVSEKGQATAVGAEGELIATTAPGRAIQYIDGNASGKAIRLLLDDSGITIQSIKDLVLRASKDLKVQGTNTELSAQASFKASGTASAEVSSPSTTIKGSATTIIQGERLWANSLRACASGLYETGLDFPKGDAQKRTHHDNDDRRNDERHTQSKGIPGLRRHRRPSNVALEP